jgi:uncharacterized protein (TIGR02001 family)
MNRTIKKFALLILFALPTSVTAGELSTTINATSDYTFNGVSQTDNDPALQASLAYAADDAWYVGAWTSNVDFGSADNTWLELDFYAGKYAELTDKLSVDAGIAYYSVRMHLRPSKTGTFSQSPHGWVHGGS